MSRNPVAPEPKDQWSGRVGFMLATIGSAIGIGSVWKLPYEVGENGGATFILFYVLGLLLVVLPLMLAEFVIGRRGGGDTVLSFGRLAARSCGSARWRWVGWLMIFPGFVILSYYSVIASMTIAYGVTAMGQGFDGLGVAEAAGLFASFVAEPPDPIRLSGNFSGGQRLYRGPRGRPRRRDRLQVHDAGSGGNSWRSWPSMRWPKAQRVRLCRFCSRQKW